MKKRHLLFILPIALVVVLAVLANGASAVPSYTSLCSGCHTAQSDVTISVAATASQPDPAAVTYAVSGSALNGGNQGFGVFKGSTRIAGQLGAGTFTVPRDGSTYTVFWVDKNPSSYAGFASTTVTAPVATTTTTTAQSTTTTTAQTTTTTVPASTTTTVPASTTTTTAQPTTTTVPASTTTTAQPTTGGVGGDHDETDGIHGSEELDASGSPDTDRGRHTREPDQRGFGRFIRAAERLITDD